MNLKVAAVQMISSNNDYDGNRLRAESYVIHAANHGARLILLPEFALAGYLYTDEFWNMAEPLKGKTYNWQKSLSEKHDVYIGNCILEKEQNDFFDTFLLTGPGHDEAWTHRKIEAPSYESFLFKGAGVNNNVFDTPIGRIGVVICFDSAKVHTLSTLKEGSPDIVLMAYSYPCLPRYFSDNDRKDWVEIYLKAPEIYAESLQTPVIVSNKTGYFSSPVLFGFATFEAEFAGGTSIFDKDANALMRMSENQTGVLVSEVLLGEQSGIVKQDGFLKQTGWLLPYGTRTRVMMELNRKVGTVRYRYSKKRKNAARHDKV